MSAAAALLAFTIGLWAGVGVFGAWEYFQLWRAQRAARRWWKRNVK